jgi:iduronate 2-sulfatase
LPSNEDILRRLKENGVPEKNSMATYMDDYVGAILSKLDQHGLRENTIVIFTSDHGYHLGEHDFWAKVSLRDESAGVPLIISVPGKKPAVCDSLVELLDLYPTVSKLCGLPVEQRLQGKDISAMLDDPTIEVRDAAFSVAPMRKGFLLREDRWAFIQYGEDASRGMELFDTVADPLQFDNLAKSEKHQAVVDRMRTKLAAKLAEVRANDL